MAEATFSDLQTAINGFSSQVKDFAVKSAIDSASQTMKQIQSSQDNEIQTRQGMEQLSNQLALHLTGVGATGQQIQSAFTATNPSALPNANAMNAEALMKGDSALGGAARKQQIFENTNKIAQMELSQRQQAMSMQAKQSLAGDSQFQKRLGKVQDTFGAWGQKLMDFEGKLGILEDGLRRGNNAIIMGAVSTIVPKALGEVGALTEADKEPFRGSMDIASQINRKLSMAIDGKVDEKSRRLLLDLVSKLKTNLNSRRNTNSNLLAKQLVQYSQSAHGGGLSLEEARQRITGDIPADIAPNMVQSSSTQQAAPIQQGPDAFFKLGQ